MEALRSMKLFLKQLPWLCMLLLIGLLYLALMPLILKTWGVSIPELLNKSNSNVILVLNQTQKTKDLRPVKSGGLKDSESFY